MAIFFSNNSGPKMSQTPFYSRNEVSKLYIKKFLITIWQPYFDIFLCQIVIFWANSMMKKKVDRLQYCPKLISMNSVSS